MQRESVASRVKTSLADRELSTVEVARAIGVTRARAAIVLREMERNDAVERVGTVRSGRVGMPATIWSLRPWL
jgi:RNA-binding protein YhbY